MDAEDVLQHINHMNQDAQTVIDRVEIIVTVKETAGAGGH